MNDAVIKFENVSKEYRLDAIGHGTLKGDVQSFIAKIMKKEDPNSDVINDNKAKRFLALDDISFEVKKGEALGIIGHNGAGKTTLLKLLAQVTGPTKGKIGYNGKISGMLGVGAGFHSELTGRENVYMNGAILGMSRKEIDSKFDEIVKFAQMEKFIDTPVKRYSSGMYVKLAFSVAAHLNSDIMIMDEVLAVGDINFRQKCLKRMRDAAEVENRTVLYVSHNMNTIRQLCNRCIVLDHGKIIFDGDVEEAIEIYMKNQGCLSQTAYNFEKISSKNNPDMLENKITALRILNKTNTQYDMGESLIFEIDINSKIDFDNLKLRIELIYADGTPVGSAPEIGLERACKGINTWTVTLDTSNITKGRYSVDLVLFKDEKLNEYYEYDIVRSAFSFEINNNDELEWNAKRWGHILLQNVSAKKKIQ